ncbi:MAG TPA: ATP-binding protein, partial [Thermoanaerobaculia bacterium]|nr:ATP-binding protein [Thermoanaerobaculia bacterium]
RQPRATGRPYLSDGFLGRGFGRDPIVAIAAPWRSPDGSFGGIVEGSLDLSRLGEVGAIFARIPAVEIFVVDGRGRLLWSGPVRHGEPLAPVRVDEAGARLTGEPERRILLGRSGVEGAGWTVVVQQPMEEIYRGLLPQVWITLSWMIGGFAPAALFAHYLSRRITRPLEELSAGLDQVELGAALPDLPPLRPNDPGEVATIVQATGRLLDRLQTSYADLSRVLAEREATIEEEIQQRTRAERERDQLFVLSLDMLCIAGFDGTFKQLNPAWERALGWTLEELLACPYRELVHPHDLEIMERELSELRSRKATSHFEIRFQTRAGGYRWLSWGVATLPGQGLLYGVVRDIDERKRVERMKDDFISVVSHELRTPLTSIHGALSLTTGGVAGKLPEQARTLVEIAAKNSDRLVRLVNDILDLEKMDSGTMIFRPSPVAVLPLLEQAAESNRAYCDLHGVALRIVEDGADARVWADADRLQQVLANLLSNAAKNSPRGGTVEIGAQRTGGRLRIRVTDHGPGIPPEFQPHVFEKFAQADVSPARQSGGTGLGLSISKAIVEQHGGRLWFETSPETGTTFLFDLPELEDGQATPTSLLERRNGITALTGPPPAAPVPRAAPAPTPPRPH